MSSEELRRSVFSSIHMSSLLRTTHSSITYPSCSFCGGSAINSRSSPKRKVALCQLSLHTNPSDSFIVWYKKQDEPKGMLWLRSCCVKKGQENTIELISRGCRGRCSYTLKFACLSTNEEWYRLLKQEARKTTSVGDDLTNDVVDGTSDLTSLDSMLTDITPLSSLTELSSYNESDENSDVGSITSFDQDSVAPLPTTKSKKKKSVKPVKAKLKVKPVFCNPLQGLVRTRKTSQPQMSSSYSVSAVTTTSSPLESIENTSRSSPDLDYWSRWSWPLKA